MMQDTPALMPAPVRAPGERTPVPEEPVVVTPPVAHPPAEHPWWDAGPGRAALIVLVVFALACMLQFTRELVLPIVVALMIAIVLSPVARALHRLLVPRALAAGIVVLLFAGSVAAGF